MAVPGQEPVPAWLPVTPRGVAAFAHASLGRLWLVQTVCALLAAGVVTGFLAVDWFPVTAKAIERMPAEGQIYDGALRWAGEAPVRLAENRFLSISVDPNRAGQLRSTSHVQLDFSRSSVRVYSLFGFIEAAYPRGYVIAFNRHELKPWWGAWSPALLALAFLAVLAGLWVTWAALATVYSAPVWLLAFFTNQTPGWGGSWRLAGAALMPGALFMIGALVVYGLAGLEVLHLLLALVLHFLVGWLYVVICPFLLAPAPGTAAQARNPFVPPNAPPGNDRP